MEKEFYLISMILRFKYRKKCYSLKEGNKEEFISIISVLTVGFVIKRIRNKHNSNNNLFNSQNILLRINLLTHILKWHIGKWKKSPL